MNTNKNSLMVILMLLAGFFLCGNGCKQSDKDENRKHDEPDKLGKVEWLYLVSEGLALAKQEGKPAFIDFYADWCPPCQQMDKVTFKKKRVIEELARFVAIKADLTRNSSSGQAAATKYGVQAIPTYILIDTQGKQTTEVGYRAPDKFLEILKNVK